MIYLNHAGTSWPKPEAVNQAMADFAQTVPPTEWGAAFERALAATCAFFGVSARFLFTTSCTSSLAVALGDFPWVAGDKLVISHMEHHALSRWYYKLQRDRGVQGIIIPRRKPTAENDGGGPLDLATLETELKQGGVRIVAMTMASNVTGEMLPYREVIRLCKQYGAYSLLDGAQTAGIIPINLAELDPDFFVFAGHKGTLTAHGLGGLYISKRVSMECPTAACEYVPGRGKPPSIFPSYCDTGSAPMMAMVGLQAGLEWLQAQGWDQLLSRRRALVKQLRLGLLRVGQNKIEIVGDVAVSPETIAEAVETDLVTGAVSIIAAAKSSSSNNEDMGDGEKAVSMQELNQHLKETVGVIASHGFQCAALGHEALGTNQLGTLRFSVGVMTTDQEIDVLLTEIETFLK